jgi:hypothetical protein
VNRARVGRALVLVALVLAVAELPRANRDLEYEVARADVAEVDGVPVIRGMPDGLPALISLLRREVPAGERFVIVHRRGVCHGLPITGGQAAVFWILYHALPRAATCDPRARWRVYLGVNPQSAGLPPGARVMSVRPNLALVEL